MNAPAPRCATPAAAQPGESVRAKRAPRPAYTALEDAILAASYPGGGAAACGEKLPLRNLASIMQRAAILGLRPPPGQRHQGLKQLLGDQDAADALAMHDRGMSFAKIGAHYCVCEATATNAVARAQCLRSGGTPAKRDSSGAIIAQDIARLRALLREGIKGCDIARQLGISANSVSYHRRQYACELASNGSRLRLPEPGAGATYTGRKHSVRTRRAVKELLMSGLGAARVSRETGMSKSQVGRVRRALVDRLARKGQTLAGCAPGGRRLVTLKSASFIPPELVAIFRQHLLERVPVRRAAHLAAIGTKSAYRLRDEFRAELADRGEALPKPILPGRGARSAIGEASWLPAASIYRFRALLETMEFGEAKAEFLKQSAASPPCEPQCLPKAAPRAAPYDFAEQLRRVRGGAKLKAVRPISRRHTDITLGGVCSYGE